MKGSVRTIGLAVCLSLLLTAGVVFAAERPSTTVTKPGMTTTVTPKPPGPCCIAGKYQGTHKDLPSKTCPKPGSGKFIMDLNQDPGCGSKIWGTVTNPTDGSTQSFEGKVTKRDKCCYIEGTMRRPAGPAGPPEETKLAGLLCKKDGKWSGKGKYTTTRPGVTCTGEWEMKQM